ncbi:MAG: MarR family transcriptional regulator [Eubacteriales bacterium]|nr:MarR family transcriptional regulator [Eubacteriales bacterium]
MSDNIRRIGGYITATRRTRALYEKMAEKTASALGITKPEADVILFLVNNPGLDTATDVVAYRGVSKGYVSKAVELLVGKGLLAVQPDAHDRRVQRMTLQKDAAPLVEALHAMQDSFFAQLCRGISRQELEAYWATQQKMLKNVERAATAPE